MAGVLCAVILGVLVITLRADQIVAGTALTLLALGVTGLLYRTMFGTTGVALTIPTAEPIAIPVLVGAAGRRPRAVRAADHDVRRVCTRAVARVVAGTHAWRIGPPRRGREPSRSDRGWYLA